VPIDQPNSNHPSCDTLVSAIDRDAEEVLLFAVVIMAD